jgi:hypothetical protein
VVRAQYLRQRCPNLKSKVPGLIDSYRRGPPAGVRLWPLLARHPSDLYGLFLQWMVIADPTKAPGAAGRIRAGYPHFRNSHPKKLFYTRSSEHRSSIEDAIARLGFPERVPHFAWWRPMVASGVPPKSDLRAPVSVGLFDELVNAGRQPCAISSSIHDRLNAQ